MANKKITDLNYYSASQFQPSDLFFVTDIAHQETKKTTAQDMAAYFLASGSSFNNTGSFTGSFIGNLYGLASSAGALNYPNNSTASYAISASYSKNSTTASYAFTASYALNGGSGGLSFTENISQSNHGFSVGDALFIQVINTVNGLTRNFVWASSTYSAPGATANINEVAGIVQSVVDANNFVIAYGGIVNFASQPSYLNPNYYGYAYFLSGSQGKLSPIDPSVNTNLPLSVRQTQISKPILIQTSASSAVLLNQRGMYDQTAGTPLTASFLYYDGSTPNGTSSYAITASYALNGGTGGGNTYNNIYPTQSFYLDTVAIGTVVTCISGGNTPNGWLLCDGGFYPLKDSSGNDTVYTALYNAIANNNGSTATYGKTYSYNSPVGGNLGGYVLDPNGRFFNVPDLRGVFVRGYNNGLSGSNLGPISPYDSGSNRQLGSIQSDSFASHNHGMPGDDQLYNANGHSWNSSFRDSFSYDANSGLSGAGKVWNTTTEGGGTETRPVNIALNYYIKYTQYTTGTTDVNNLTTGNYPLGGDVGGTLGNTSINKLQGNKISVAAPASGALLQYDGTQWTPIVPSIPKLIASVSFDGTSNIANGATQTMYTSYNIKNVIRDGANTGRYIVNFASAITGNYYVLGTAGGPYSGVAYNNVVSIAAKNTTSVSLFTNDGNGGAENTPIVHRGIYIGLQ